MKSFIVRLDKRLGRLYVPVILLLLTLVLFVIGYPFVKPVQTTVGLNAIATNTIRANKTVEDKQATEKNQQNSESAVAPVYEKDDAVATQKINEVKRFFSVMKEYRQELAKDSDVLETDMASRRATYVSRFFQSLESTNEAIRSYAIFFSERLITQLLMASEADFNVYASLSEKSLSDILKQDIYPTAEDIEKAKDQAYGSVQIATYSDNTRQLVKELVDAGIVATMVVNQEATDKAKVAARASAPAVMIMQGEVIVREGEAIGVSAFRKLQLLGMTNNTYNMNLLMGYVLLLVIQFITVVYFVLTSTSSHSKQNLYVNLYAFLVVILSGLTLIMDRMQSKGIEYIPVIVPIGIIPLLTITKAKRRLSILALCFLVAIYFFISDKSATTQTQLTGQFYALVGFFSTVLVSANRRSRIRVQFLQMLLLYVGLISALALSYGIELWSTTFLTLVLYAIANAVLSMGILFIGKPYFDLLFEDRAVLKLVELSQPNNPLLKELIAKAPGTYHHSIMVANLSANAVELIGGDSLFTRVACYYHDVGKVKNPSYFVENLPTGMESPHKLLTPFESRDVIFDHVTSGVKLLETQGLPQGIIDICAQHHGTTVMKYFYVTAKEADDTVSEDMFRYPGPKPQTKEAAVISIADTVEAATRSMTQPTHDAIAKLVKETIQSRILDGQFDQSPITLAELAIVEQSLVAGLSGSYHTRVSYPKLKGKNK